MIFAHVNGIRIQSGLIASWVGRIRIHVNAPLDLHKWKQGNPTNLNNSFSIENEKRAAQVGLEPTTYCLLGRCSTTKLPR